MPTLFSHTLVAVTAGKLSARCVEPGSFWTALAVCSCLPDIDVAGFLVGIRYGDMLGHRGLSHSLLFAMATGLAAALLTARSPHLSPAWWGRAALFSLVTASHGVLDAFTAGGLGVAFFSPFDPTRYFFPVRPLAVSPIGLASFLSRRGFETLASEALWIGLPCLLLLTAAWLLRRKED